ncbi:hypothetical protein SAMD00019534_085940 [Acytostelium subglobosum LB1]|uniref:hypothetical protein n=1 Tax=Acytostelium subglobosum LB1 TaxID=1410327 RepID=UPI000644BA2D|nr:hypothetical protein SAMD00019534_085940 [Acytostelium subglobosum LB1]GAM25419.1 hypothetical protein SAMD00019534_085940 [Acytostelium subglobosum LB1]|eukprot:XP_012751405.1 hypothetical protein SAMD00019534_085940 [Acytostelium subglobosum LB1]
MYQSDIVGVNGGHYISVCHDGDSYIYLVGGIGLDVENKYTLCFDRVDRFNLDSERFEHVAQELTFGRRKFSNSFFHKNLLYIVNDSDISSLDVNTKEFLKVSTSEDVSLAFSCFDGIDNVYIKTNMMFTRYTTFFHNNLLYIVNGLEIKSYNSQARTYREVTKITSTENDDHNSLCCFDGIDNIYIKTKLMFTRYTLSTKRQVSLQVCPIHEDLMSLVYDAAGSRIFYFFGEGENHLYSIQDDTWTLLLNDNDSAYHLNQGICLIRD